jgi:hypothetical protein
MLIIGCDLHTRYQMIAMLDTGTGEIVTRRLEHENGEAKAFYAQLPKPALIGIEATGYTQWFERMVAEFGHELWIGDPAEIRARAVRRQKTDTRDAEHLLDLLLSKRFPRIWVPTPEERDLRQLLKHRDKLVRMQTSVKNQLHFLAMSQGICRKRKLWSARGRGELEGPELGILGQRAAEGTAGPARQSQTADRGTRSGGEDGGRASSPSRAVDGSERRGADHGPGLRADGRSGGALSQQPEVGQLSGTESRRELQRRSPAAGSHSQARQPNDALVAGGSRPHCRIV